MVAGASQIQPRWPGAGPRPVRQIRSTPLRLRGPRVPPARSVVNPTTCSIRKPRGGGRSGPFKPFKPFKPGAQVLKLAATGDTAVRRPAISHYIARGRAIPPVAWQPKRRRRCGSRDSDQPRPDRAASADA